MSVRDRASVLVLHGPNLNLLGAREPEIYGSGSLDDLVALITEAGAERGLDVEHLQSNHEGELVDAIQSARGRCDAIVINPGALTHYAWSLHDALRTFDGPVRRGPSVEPQRRGSRGDTRRWSARSPSVRSAGSDAWDTSWPSTPSRSCLHDNHRRRPGPAPVDGHRRSSRPAEDQAV